MRNRHALDILRRGFQTDDKHLFALLGGGDGFFCRHIGFAASGARGSRKPFGDRFRVFERIGVKLRVKQSVELLWLDFHQRFLFGNLALFHKVYGDFESRDRGTLAVSGLQHVKFAFFNGELHVLHVFIVVFENPAYFVKLFEHFRILFCQFAYRKRRSDTGNDVFALSVHQIFAEQRLFAGSRVSGKRHAGAAVVAHVAEYHRLHVDGGAPAGRNVVHSSVINGARVVPRTEHGKDSRHELFFRVLRKFAALRLFVISLELFYKFFHIVGVKFGVEFHAFLFFHRVDYFFEVGFFNFHNDVGKHLYKSTVGVIREARIARQIRHDFNHFVVKTQVENGVHHARHRRSRARTHRNQQRIFVVAEFFARHLFDFGESLEDLFFYVV